jgi:hypothetical protein
MVIGGYMTYKEIRDKFCEVTGRYDLITATLEDNGADFFLNAAQRYLDRSHDHQKATARSVQSVAAGTLKVYAAGLRAVKEVWYASSDGTGIYPLELCSLGEMKEYYGKKLSTETQGPPAYYAPASFRPYPDTVLSATWTGYQDIEDLLLSDTHYQNNGIVIMPTPAVLCYVSIVGLFYSPALTATLSGATWTSAKSFWTENHPDTLIAAAAMKLHGLYQNTSGAADMKLIVQGDIIGLDQDDAEYDTAGNSQMGG